MVAGLMLFGAIVGPCVYYLRDCFKNRCAKKLPSLVDRVMPPGTSSSSMSDPTRSVASGLVYSKARGSLSSAAASDSSTPASPGPSVANPVTEQLQITHLQTTDVKYSSCDRGYCATVNEPNPFLVRGHLARMQPGWLVVVGGLRALFDLLLAPRDRCHGLIVLDQDARVIHAHRGFVLLLLIASNRIDALQLLQNWSDKDGDTENLEIKTRINRLTISQEIKDYYLTHLNELFTPLRWMLKSQTSEDRRIYAVEYNKYIDSANILRIEQALHPLYFMQQDESFDTLQQFAREGKMLSMTGDIYNPPLIPGISVSVIDSSNCRDYYPNSPILNVVGEVLHIQTRGTDRRAIFESAIQESPGKIREECQTGPVGSYTSYPGPFTYTGEDIEDPVSPDDFARRQEEIWSRWEERLRHNSVAPMSL